MKSLSQFARGGFVALIGVTLLCGYGLAQTTLTVARNADVEHLNPFRSIANVSSEVTYNIHDTLTTFDANLELGPSLATSWALLDDGVTWRFHLREGVFFHSGAPFTAEVVQWNLETITSDEDPGVAKEHIATIASISIVDDHTIDITLTEPNAIFPNQMGAPAAQVRDMEHYERVGHAAYGNDPSGTGAFRFVRWDPGERVILERNDDYWGEGPYVDRVEFVVIPEASARLLALQSGEVDMVLDIPAEQIDALERRDDINVYRRPTLRLIYLALNTQHPKLTHEVRWALAHAVNRDQIDAIIGDQGVPAYGLGPEEVFGYKPIAPEFDVERANELLSQAGWEMRGDGFRYKDGERLELSVLARGVFSGSIEALQVLQLQYREIGVDLRISQVETGAYFEAVRPPATRYYQDGTVPEYQLLKVGWGVRTGEMGYNLRALLCDSPRSEVRELYHCNPEYDEAFHQSQRPISDEERLEGYHAMSDIFAEEQMRIPLFILQRTHAANSRISGFEPKPDDSFNVLHRVQVN